MSTLQALRRLIFPTKINKLFSEEQEEEAALRVAARLSRDATNTQDQCVTTSRIFELEMDEYARKVEAKKFIFQR